jgi:hypothetical protein
MSTLLTAWAWAKEILGWLAWFGLGAIPTVAAIAAFIYVKPLRLPIAFAGAMWVNIFLSYTWGDVNGAHRIQELWDAAVAKAIKDGEANREAAERDVAAEPDGVLANDPFNRNRRGK